MSHDPVGNFTFFAQGHAGGEFPRSENRYLPPGPIEFSVHRPPPTQRSVPSRTEATGGHPSDDLRRLPRGGIIGSSSGARFLGHHHPSEDLRRSLRAEYRFGAYGRDRDVPKWNPTFPGASTVAHAYAEALRGSGVLAAFQIAHGLLARDPFS